MKKFTYQGTNKNCFWILKIKQDGIWALNTISCTHNGIFRRKRLPVVIQSVKFFLSIFMFENLRKEHHHSGSLPLRQLFYNALQMLLLLVAMSIDTHGVQCGYMYSMTPL